MTTLTTLPPLPLPRRRRTPPAKPPKDPRPTLPPWATAPHPIRATPNACNRTPARGWLKQPRVQTLGNSPSPSPNPNQPTVTPWAAPVLLCKVPPLPPAHARLRLAFPPQQPAQTPQGKALPQHVTKAKPLHSTLAITCTLLPTPSQRAPRRPIHGAASRVAPPFTVGRSCPKQSPPQTLTAQTPTPGKKTRFLASSLPQSPQPLKTSRISHPASRIRP